MGVSCCSFTIGHCTYFTIPAKFFVWMIWVMLYERKRELRQVEHMSHLSSVISIEQYVFVKAFWIHIFSYYFHSYFLYRPFTFIIFPTLISYICQTSTSIVPCYTYYYYSDFLASFLIFYGGYAYLSQRKKKEIGYVILAENKKKRF